MAKSSLISLVSSNSVDFWLWIIFECMEIINIIIFVFGAEDWSVTSEQMVMTRALCDPASVSEVS